MQEMQVAKFTTELNSKQLNYKHYHRIKTDSFHQQGSM